MKRILKYVKEYLNAKIIFAMDMVTSIISSAIILVVLGFMSGSHYYFGSFALWWMGGTVVGSALSMYIIKSYYVIIRHMTLTDIGRFVLGIFLSDVLLGVIVSVACIFNVTVLFALLADSLLTLLFVLGIRFIMLGFYQYFRSKVSDATQRRRILVYGTSDKSVAAISRFGNSKHYRLMGFITPEVSEDSLKLSGYQVMSCSSEDEFRSIAYNLSLYAVLFATDADVKNEENRIIKFCIAAGVKTLVIPSISETYGGKMIKEGVRKVNIEDMLGRPEIKISLDEIRQYFQDKVIMVTGAAGSIGSELCRQLSGFGVKQLVLYDNAETPMHILRLELESRFPELKFVPVIGSVRHKDRLDYAFRYWRPQIVFHAAAYKHVPLMEENPCEAVFANVHGSRMVADKCVEYGVEMMVMISTDKAVNPTNIMGCSKRLAEIYVQSLGLAMTAGQVKGNTKFVTTRFGNVLGSNGSVIPRFREQIEHGGPVTVTHPEINRFFMTIPEACRLVMEAATLSTGNQIFVFDMGEPVRIVDLAKRMIEFAGLKVGEDIRIEYTGLRPGEKLYEEVLVDEESTEPTSHDRIRIAKVREYDYFEVLRDVNRLAELSKVVDIPEMVKLMKRMVPEFKSSNSRFEIYDK